MQPYLESLAYRVVSEHGSIVFTGDTEPVESVIELARGADMMLCMCWDTDAAMNANGEYGGMTGTTSAGLLAAQAGVRTLVLTHINAHLDSPGVREEGIRDVAAVFDGEIVFGEELLSLDVSRSPEALPCKSCTVGKEGAQKPRRRRRAARNWRGGINLSRWRIVTTINETIRNRTPIRKKTSAALNAIPFG